MPAVALANAWWDEWAAKRRREFEAALQNDGLEEELIADAMICWTETDAKCRADFLLRWLDDFMAARRGELGETLQ